MITLIHHVQITVPRAAESTARAFYCGILGLTEIAKPATLTNRGGFWVAIGAMQLHIGTEDGIARMAYTLGRAKYTDLGKCPHSRV